MQFLRFRREADGRQIVDVALRGPALYAEPLLNKGSAFTTEERAKFGLEGLLPATQKTMEQQLDRVHQMLRARPDPLDKYVELAALQDRNEHLFFRLLRDNLEEFLPIVYTPTVGAATRHYSNIFRRGRGLFITPAHKGRIAKVLRQAVKFSNVRLLVVTDNEAILGIGDQGAGGMTISIGKLSIYSAAAGIHPAQTLPISLDVGTDNPVLLNDEAYLGLRQPRLRGKPYFELLDEFVDAINEVFPGALIQWEDFRKDNALAVLSRYADRVASFNDDIQGTGAIAVAGTMSAARVLGSRIADQRIIVFGAGAAGLGITQQLRAAMVADGLTPEVARQRVGVIDSRGLLVDDKPQSEEYKKELAWPAQTAADYGLGDPTQRDLASVVRHFKPTVLIGTSGIGQTFTESIVREMAKHVARPVILPLSNPTENAEAVPADLLAWTEGRCLVATGSPFDPVQVGGRTVTISQGNNAFVFPGLGLGVLVGEIKRVTPGVLAAAARALANLATQEELDTGMLFPRIHRLPEAARAVAEAVVAAAAAEGVGRMIPEADIPEQVAQATWTPDYPEFVAV